MTHLEQGNAFWEGIEVKTKFQPYSIMFQVEDNCPVYMNDHKDWLEYFIEAFPSQSTTAFIVEGEVSLHNQRLSLHLYKTWSMYQGIINEHAMVQL